MTGRREFPFHRTGEYLLLSNGKVINPITKTRPSNNLAIFHGCKNDNFQMKNCDIFLIFVQNIGCGYTLDSFTGVFILFLIFAQNIDCGYTLEPPQCGGSNEYPKSMF